jgi:hypothetical protein
MDILQCNGKTVTSDCAAPCTLEAGGGGGALGHYFHAVIEDAIGVPSPRSDPDEPDRVDGILDPRLHAIFRRHIRALTDTPLLLPAAPSHRGRRLGDVTRYPIDRKVLLSPREQRGSDAAIAFGLDCSDSMARVLARFAGALHELVQASMAVGCVVATFHFGSEVRRVAPRRVSRAPLLNQTRTDLFLRQADEWLKRQRQRRRNVILFTDGEPQYPVECAEAVRRLQQQGIQILVGTVTGLDPSRLDLSMPSVSCFEIGETDLEAGLLRAVRRLAWR